MTITVTQLNNYLKGILDLDGVLDNVSVSGEITNVKAYGSGWYFSLKDEQAAINCFCYASNVRPEQGARAVCEGKINYFVKSGSISFFVRRFNVTKDLGDAYLRFVQLKEKLAKEGLFEELRKQPIPRCCKKIGVVTSPTGAVIHDIENVALRRQPFSQIILYPVKVQGVGAAAEICQGIAYFNSSDVDVVIVGRGGGSDEDLSVFNDEGIVRAVAACVKPVVSAVGHGVDYTLCDFVADRRAVTPSEAAELVTIDAAEERMRITSTLRALCDKLCSKREAYLNLVTADIRHIASENKIKIEGCKQAAINVVRDSQVALAARIEKYRARTEKAVAALSAANPASILKKGYAYVSKNGQSVCSVSQLSSGDELDLTLSDGKATVVVK